jgi:hypothetical protein
MTRECQHSVTITSTATSFADGARAFGTVRPFTASSTYKYFIFPASASSYLTRDKSGSEMPSYLLFCNCSCVGCLAACANLRIFSAFAFYGRSESGVSSSQFCPPLVKYSCLSKKIHTFAPWPRLQSPSPDRQIALVDSHRMTEIQHYRA